MNSNYKPLLVAVFLVVAGLCSKSLLPARAGVLEVKGVLADSSLITPSLVSVAQGAGSIDSAAVTQSPTVSMDSAAVADPNGLANLDMDNIEMGSAIQDPGQAVGPAISDITLSPTTNYTIKKGDTFSKIAARFSLTAGQLKAANPNVKTLKLGAVLVIPANPNSSQNDSATSSALPNFNSYFTLPAQGYNSGVLDNNNGIQIANSCGTPVVAAADGIVAPDPNNSDDFGGWNGGYGNFVFIQHSFGNEIFTRYAHLEESSVQVGDLVKRGQQIGLMGQTGGAANCGLDFEVIGAQNPFGR